MPKVCITEGLIGIFIFYYILNQISKHISYLLLTCGCVSVPGLGTFTTEYVKAKFDSSQNIFYPSKIRITFLGSKTDNNFNLLDSLTRQLNIPSSEAKEMVEEYVAKINHRLRVNRYCRVEGIGYLICNQDTILLKDTFWKRTKFLRLLRV